MKTKYSNRELELLTRTPLIHPEPSKHYRKLLIESITERGWDVSKLDAPDRSNDIMHDRLAFDLSEMINVLAQTVLDERMKLIAARAEIRDTLQQLMKELKP